MRCTSTHQAGTYLRQWFRVTNVYSTNLDNLRAGRSRAVKGVVGVHQEDGGVPRQVLQSGQGVAEVSSSDLLRQRVEDDVVDSLRDD